ncbi:MAG: FmdE family protein [Thermodesulfobacteriota bacterium]|nr:FmdE family protein [Thermodesulfobacteriota bacterium]
MKNAENIKFKLPEDLKKCIEFHGHLCPGLVYGYLVAKEAINLLKLKRSKDEEVVVISENDSCAVDALQVLLGTSTGKGKKYYRYGVEFGEEFSRLDEAISSDTASEREKWRHKMLKAKDLLSKPFGDVFSTKEVDIVMPPYAPLARSEACAKCGEMTMSTKMVCGENGKRICIPCSS